MSETIKEETAEAVQAEPQGLTLEKFEEATEVVSKVISETKLVYSEYFSNLTGNKVYLKPENMQYTGAYKVRGAFYKISTLSDEEKQRGLITASAGNHAQGVAYAAKLAGCKATVVMPTTTPLMKVNRTRSYGAEVVLHGDVVLPKYHTVIFVNGCFWHRHDCSRFVWPSSNQDYWRPKILRNVERDKKNTEELKALGWNVITVWECELKRAVREENLNLLITKIQQSKS